MGIFGNSSNAFDPMVEKVTDEKVTSEDWGLIMSVCDRVGATKDGPKECIKALVRRLNHQDPHVVLKAIILLDACVSNCGKQFLLEVASRDFETEFKKIFAKAHPKIVEKLKEVLKKWAEGEFSRDPSLSLIPSLYASLKKDGIDFSGSPGSSGASSALKMPADPLVVSSKQEEEDIAKAIQLSLQQQEGKSGLYPSSSGLAVSGPGSSSGPVQEQAKSTEPVKEKKARALYDFEAAEDNELTFKAGELLVIIDDSDPNWWKGSNHRGEGLFPSNFVTPDTEDGPGAVETERKRSVVFNEEVHVQEVEPLPKQETIDEGKIEELLAMLHDLDPTSAAEDPPALPRLTEEVLAMGPLIDKELETVDRRHAELTKLSHELVDALSLYHSLMAQGPAQHYSLPHYQYMPPQPHPNMPPQPHPSMAPQPHPGMAPNMGHLPPSLPHMAPSLGAVAPSYPGPGLLPQGVPGQPQPPMQAGQYFPEQGYGGHQVPQQGTAPPPTPPLHFQQNVNNQ